jgi:hypothetical protein
MAVNYRTTGPWGAGKGSNLTAAEVDGNFWDHEGRLVAVEANPALPHEIASMSAVGTGLYVRLDDGTQYGPIQMPVLSFRWRGEWALDTAYEVLDVFKVTGDGMYYVLFDHTTPASGAFDSSATESGGLPIYQQLFGAVDQPAPIDPLYDIAFYYPALVPGGEFILAQFMVPRDLTIPVALASSLARLEVAPTQSFVISIYASGPTLSEVLVADFFWTEGYNDGVSTYYYGDKLDLTAGDLITIKGPSTADATAAQLAITLAALRTEA